MAYNGTYGTTKPVTLTNIGGEVDIYYHYRPTRSSEDSDFPQFKKLDNSLLSNSKVMLDATQKEAVLPGMYDLRLPLNLFGKAGIYTVYIKPKEYESEIIDVSTLAAHPEIRGIVLRTSGLPNADNDLKGYRVEYMLNDTQRTDIHRIITSNFRCEPVGQNLNDSTASGVRYAFNPNSNLMFCTLTPSTALSYKADAVPFIGEKGQKVMVVSTAFNPIMLEIEMVKHDIDSVYGLLGGTQIRDLNHGIITTFDDDGKIIHQASYGNITNPSQNIDHDFKIKNEGTYDFTQETQLNKIINNI